MNVPVINDIVLMQDNQHWHQSGSKTEYYIQTQNETFRTIKSSSIPFYYHYVINQWIVVFFHTFLSLSSLTFTI